MNMTPTRERIAGFLLGISLGTMVGFLLRQPIGRERRVGATEEHTREHGWKGGFL